MVNQSRSFGHTGFEILNGLIEIGDLESVRDDLLQVAVLLGIDDARGNDLQSVWRRLCANDRTQASKLYNAFKLLPSVWRIASSPKLDLAMKNLCDFQKPSILDVNCRIDDFEGEKYLFDWHQDYWFSMSSKESVVLWIPVLGLIPEMGGLELFSLEETQGKIFKARRGDKWDSYADAVVLNEPPPQSGSIQVCEMEQGQILAFSFRTLHRSIQVKSPDHSRFTIQVRIADLGNEEFKKNSYKPGTVNQTTVTYLES